jgi:hypothetical protein
MFNLQVVDELDNGINEIEQDSPLLPPNIKVQLFGKSKYVDGTESVHFPVSNAVTTDSPTNTLQVTYDPTTTLKSEDNVAELGLYSSIRSRQDNETPKLTFQTNEIANSFIQTLSSLYGVTPENKPASPMVWFGYKYIYIDRWQHSGSSYVWVVRVQDFNRNNTKKSDGSIEPENERVSWFILNESEVTRIVSTLEVGLPSASTVTNVSSMPDQVLVNLVGDKIPYNLVAYDYEPTFADNNDLPDNFKVSSTFGTGILTIDATYIYKNAYVDAITSAVNGGGLRVKISNIGSVGSNYITNDKI